MDAQLLGLASIGLRFVHIASAIVLLGGLFYARVMLLPESVQDRALALRFRPWLIGSALGLLISGLYTYMTRIGHVVPSYHMWAGIKILFALHVLAVALLLARGGMDEARKARLMKGAVASGFVVVLLGGYLRWLAAQV
jgi:hypothetical protein